MVDAVATIEYDNVGYGIGIITPCSAITRGRGRCLRKDHRASAPRTLCLKVRLRSTKLSTEPLAVIFKSQVSRIL